MDSFNRDAPSADDAPAIAGDTPPGSGSRLAASGATTAMADRRGGRDSLFLLARMRIDGIDPWREVRVRNLSEGGLMAEVEQSVALGAPVELELRGVGAVTGRIAWQAEGRAGVAFASPIDPLLARKPVGGGTMTPHYAKALITRR